jgi:dolichyldiphosphatase
VLKRVINEQRPASARKADPGMPSSHANSLAFLATYAAAAALDTMGGRPLARALAAAALGTCLFLVGGGATALPATLPACGPRRPEPAYLRACCQGTAEVRRAAPLPRRRSLLQAWLRVRLGYHTREQVAVGLLVGSSSAVSWWWLGASRAFGLVQQQQAAGAALSALTLAAMAGFGYANLLAWHTERQQHQQGGEVAKLS